jgi:parallel beta-helix repeat protein
MNLKLLSVSLALALALGVPLLAFRTDPAYAANTIYILANGAINPPTANISTTDLYRYVFTGPVNDAVVIQRDDILLDGHGYTLAAPASDQALYLYYRTNVTIANLTIQQSQTGLLLEHCTGCQVLDNVFTGNSWHAINLDTSDNTVIRRNRVIDNANRALRIDGSSDNVIDANTVAGNYRGIEVTTAALRNQVTGNNITANHGVGISLTGYSSHNIIAGNSLTGNQGGITVEMWSSNNTISGNTVRNDPGIGLTIVQSPNCTVTDNAFTGNAFGIRLMYVNTTRLRRNQLANSSSYDFGLYFNAYADFRNDVDTTNTVNGKPIYYWVDQHGQTVPADAGIVILHECTDVRIEDLNVTDTVWQAIVIGNSRNVTVTGCHVDNASYRSEYGLWLWNASSCHLDGNYLHSFIGLQLDYSANNTIHGNTLTGSGNWGAVNFEQSENNVFYHNNFTGNYFDVYPDGVSTNQWDHGYPDGGNYWDTYVTRMASPRDEHSGPGQDQPGPDGFWDQPFPLDDYNIDHYPIVPEYSPPLLLAALLAASTVTALVLRGKRARHPASTR